MSEVTIYSSTEDGKIENSESLGVGQWMLCHNAPTGDSLDKISTYSTNGIATGGQYTFYIHRSFFYFDLSGLQDKLISKVELKIKGATQTSGEVCVQQGTQSDTLILADFDAFTGSIFGKVVWSSSENIIEFSQIGINYIKDLLGSGTAKICCREYDHDYLDIEPGGTFYNNGVKYTESTGTIDDPQLIITYADASVDVKTEIAAAFSTAFIDVSGEVIIAGTFFKEVQTEIAAQVPPTGLSDLMCNIVCNTVSDKDVKTEGAADPDENAWWNPWYGWGCPSIPRVRYYMENR